MSMTQAERDLLRQIAETVHFQTENYQPLMASGHERRKRLAELRYAIQDFAIEGMRESEHE